MEFLVLCFFLGLATGVVAKIKGSSFWLWFLVGACTFGFGLIAALLHRVERAEPRRICPTCARDLPVTDQVCMRCGTDLDPPPQPAGPRMPAAPLP